MQLLAKILTDFLYTVKLGAWNRPKRTFEK